MSGRRCGADRGARRRADPLPTIGLRWSAHWVGAVDRAGNGALTPVETSAGFICLPADDLLHLVKKVTAAGIKAKPDLGVIPPDPRTFEWYVKN
jgi:hypothetical protein